MKDLWTKWGDGFLTILFIVLLIITVVVYISDGNLWAIQVLSACLGAIITIIATRLLLSKQSDLENKRDIERREADEKEKRDFQIYNAKLEVYSVFVSSMYETLKKTRITEEEFIDLRTKLLGEVCFYVNNKDVLEGIKNELDNVKDLTDDNKIAKAFAGITYILQKDLRRDDWVDSQKEVLDLWGKFEEISANTNDDSETTNFVPVPKDDNQQEDKTPDQPERLEHQAWHFIMWNDTQLDKLKEGVNELSLIEYGEYWRTNLVKQVGKDDIVFLFRRGGYGYIGAYRAVGWRVFYFKEKREEKQIFGKEPEVITDEQYLSDIKEYDIYESNEDGATTCANIIVEPIAFVEDGVGYSGGVYRRTISRYDPHYAGWLKNKFQEKGQWKKQ